MNLLHLKPKTVEQKKKEAQIVIKLARNIRRESRKKIKLPDNFNVVKFIRENR